MRRILDVLLLTALVSCSFWKLTLTRQYTMMESPDIANVILPWYDLQAHALREGYVALWDPYLLAGQPLVGQLQPGVTNPLTYLLIAMPLGDGHIRTEYFQLWYVLIHYLAAWFAYWFFCDLGVSRAASVLAATFYAIAGYMGNTWWPQYILGAVWAPLIFLFLLRSLRGRRPIANAAMSGLFLGMAYLSGHHQVPFLFTLAIGGVLLYCALRRVKFLPVVLARTCALVVAAALVSAFQMIPAIEYGRRAVRWVSTANPVDWKTQVPYIGIETNSLRPVDLLHMVVPGFQGMANPFAGIVALAFVAAAIVLTFDAPRTRLFAMLAIAALLFSVARHNVLHGVMYALIPSLDKARSPAVALSVAHFALAVLVAFGADAVLARSSAWTPRLARWLAAFGAVALAAVFCQPSFTRNIPQGDDRLAMVGVCGLLLAGVLAGLASGRIGRGAAAAFCVLLLLVEHSSSTGFSYLHREQLSKDAVSPRLMATRDIAEFLHARPGPFRVGLNYDDMLFNFGDWHHIETMAGYVPTALASSYRLTWWNTRNQAMHGVAYYVARKPAFEGQRELFTGSSGLKVFAVDGAMPRAWAVHELQTAPDPETGAKLVLADGFDPARQAVLVGSAPELEKCPEEDLVRIEYTDMDSLRIDARMPCRGMVIVSDNAFPGWAATIDGKPAPIYQANTTFRGVVVERGLHRIRMEYRPWPVYGGLAITLLGIVAVCGLYLRKAADGPAVL